MHHCGLDISDLIVSDVDRIEFNIASSPNGVFDVQPRFKLFGNSMLDFDHMVIEYEGGVVPEYEGEEDSKGGDSLAE